MLTVRPKGKFHLHHHKLFWLHNKHTPPFRRYVFVEYASAAEALEVLKGTNGYKFDKNHTFTVNLLTDFEKYDNILEKWENPTPQPFKEQGCLQYYLLEQDACDQFSVVYEQGDKVAVYNNSQPEPALLEERPVRHFYLFSFLFFLLILLFHLCVEMDRDFGSVVAIGNLFGHFPRQRYRPVGRWKVPADHAIQPPWSSVYRFFTLRKVSRFVQSFSRFQSHGWASSHYHLGCSYGS